MQKIFYPFILITSILCIRCSSGNEATTTPSDVTNLTAKPGVNQATLSWEKPKETDVKQYWVKMTPLTADAFPINKDKNSYTVSNLKELPKDTKFYKFTLLVQNESGEVSKGVSVSVTPLKKDIKAPSNVTNFFATSGTDFVILNWVKPSDDDLAGYKLTYEPGSKSVDLQKTIQSYTVSSLVKDTEYTFTIKSYDDFKNESSGITLKSTPKDGDNTPPGVVSDVSFSGDYATKTFTIGWVNPSDNDLENIQITYSYEGGSPEVVVVAKDKKNYTIKGTYEKNYTLILKSKDNSDNYSKGVIKKVRFGNLAPSSPEDISAFNGFTEILAGKLKINGTSLTDLSGLSKLERIEGKFDITGNLELTTLEAFSNLKFVGSRVLITNNKKLSNLCGLKTLVNNGAPDSYTVEGNAANPTKAEIKACK